MASAHAPNEAKEFEARTAGLVLDGGDTTVEDIESFGYDQSKNHELQYTIDQNAIWVKGTPEITGSFVLKSTSSSVPEVETLFMDDEVFNINIQLSNDAFGGDDADSEDPSAGESLNFVGCMITDFNHSDYQIDELPTVTADWQGVNRGDGN